MSVTSIQFIGLFVVMMNTGAGLHILLPHFPNTPYADHTSVIQYAPEVVVSASWPGITACGPNGSLRCAPIDVETITFSGASDPAPTDIIGPIPHLKCCCQSMSDILAKYKDQKATGKLSAHIFVEHGVAQAITATNGRVDTWVTAHSVDPTGITVIGSNASGSFNIVFKPGAQFSILNSTPESPTMSHFLAYYLMGVGSSKCTSTPTNDAACAAQTTDCNLPTPVGAPRKPAVKRAVILPAIQRKKVSPLGATGDCSNSHWP
ncbi:MAG TPA: hypothetical protein VGQ21_14280 [Thermoanaerobaculia bacterium]|jgi:hypothetical protein|nr:hypothetical protein [Thermoanaerobaculia bacterium]